MKVSGEFPAYLVLLRVGFTCRRHYCRRGALLPHPFTLTSTYVGAVYFLLHWPSRRFETPVPDVIRHTALRSSDFPPPADLRLR